MSCKPTLIATVSGADGVEICYVSFADVVANHGAIVGVPTITTSPDSLVDVSEESLSFEGEVNGVPYTAGQMLTFKVTSLTATYQRKIKVLIPWTATDGTKRTTVVTVDKLEYDPD